MAQQRLRADIIKPAVIHTLFYFSYFSYPVYENQLYRYLSIPATEKAFKKALKGMRDKNQVNYDEKSGLYTLRGHGIHAVKREKRAAYSASKIAIGEHFAHILSRFPYIYLIGISGSCAMDNAKPSDDIDVMIISAPGCIWLSRLTAIFIAKMLRRHRQRGQKNTRDLICLNLFFDYEYMGIPTAKQSIYGAHELMQMRPMFIRGRVYENFLRVNKWVEKYLPQAYTQSLATEKPSSGSTAYTPSRILGLFQLLSLLAKYIQLGIMARRTHERVSDTQLWFFPQDFQLKLEKKKII